MRHKPSKEVTKASISPAGRTTGLHALREAETNRKIPRRDESAVAAGWALSQIQEYAMIIEMDDIDDDRQASLFGTECL